MIYITGDIHGDLTRIINFVDKIKTTKDDILIILGDVGFNYYGSKRDELMKKLAQELPITLFCIHGNHEARPSADKYKEKEWNGGVVFVEEEFPDILFAKDGEVYNLNNIETMVIGGAYSVDKEYRLMMGYKWWKDEQPSDETKAFVEENLTKKNWKIDAILSHTVPEKYEPVEVFLSFIDQRKVDKTTEKWLDKIEEKLEYKKWYAGHYHTNKNIDKIRLMFEDIEEFSI